MKGVNSNTLNETYDPGKDGDGNILARDAFGFSLHYFEGDYGSIAGTNDFLADQTGSDLIANSNDLYNGNIGRMVTTITEPTTREILPLGNAYRYDQLNRLSESRSFATLNLGSNSWNAASTYDSKYFNQFEYDANGNIIFQRRHNKAGATIDKLDYNYKRNLSGKLLQNRLYHVNDVVADADFSDDIDDMDLFDATIATINDVNNYKYDQEGRLIYDEQEDIENIEWRVDGKVLKITRPSGNSKKNIIFEYDAMGHRVGKHVLTSSDVLEKSTYYILDASGNTMSVYERTINETDESVDYYLAENHIYGSSRLGVLDRHVSMLGLTTYDANSTVITHQIGKRTYELANHLGNVLSVISDKPIPHDDDTDGTNDWYLSDIRVAQDYSPFGVTLDGRNFSVDEKYRYGYQGSEKDNEVKGEGNSYTTEFRQLDPRLGRWLSIDPIVHSFQSTYCLMNNNPILNTDKRGGTIDPSSQGTFDEHKKNTNERLNELTKTRDKMVKKGNNTMIPYLTESISQLKNALKEMDEMESSPDLTYKIEMTTDKDPELAALNADGLTTRRGKTVTIKATDLSSLGHEFKHGYQYMNGELDEFNITHDYFDELDAFKRGFAFSQYSVEAATGYSFFTKELMLKYYVPGTSYAVSEERLKITDKASVVLQFTASIENRETLLPALLEETRLKETELIKSGMDATQAASEAANMKFDEFMKRLNL